MIPKWVASSAQQLRWSIHSCSHRTRERPAPEVCWAQINLDWLSGPATWNQGRGICDTLSKEQKRHQKRNKRLVEVIQVVTLPAKYTQVNIKPGQLDLSSQVRIGKLNQLQLLCWWLKSEGKKRNDPRQLKEDSYQKSQGSKTAVGYGYQ